MKIYFDGGARPNPGLVETAVVAGGRSTVRRDHGQGDNGDAEWLALLDAVAVAQALGLRDVVLLGDSLMVVNHTRARTIPPRFRDYRARFDAAARTFDRVRLRHIGRAQNLAGIVLAQARQWP